jgi:hypothetical protein
MPKSLTAWSGVDYLIASGCLMPAAVLRSVGLMNVDLFSYVGLEWGRAKTSEVPVV